MDFIEILKVILLGFEDKIQGMAYGKLKMIEDKGDYKKLTLTNVTLEIKENIEYPAGKIIVYITSSEEYKIGTILKFKKA